MLNILKGSVNKGTRHWWLQRATAVVLLPLVVWFIASIATLVGADYGAIIIWVKHPFTSVLLILFMAILFYHLRLGVHEVLEDYANSLKAKRIGIFLNNSFCLIAALLSIYAIIKIFFGI